MVREEPVGESLCDLLGQRDHLQVIAFRIQHFQPDIELLRRRRSLQPSAQESQNDELRNLLRLTVQGVASGMRTTG